MKKFLIWMHEKRYVEYKFKNQGYTFPYTKYGEEDSPSCFGYEGKMFFKIPTQMLIGYMIEYLLNNGMVDTYDILSECFAQNINDVYNYLEKEIINLKV